MLKRTWPYGTMRRGRVLDRKHIERADVKIPVLVVEDDQNEGHIILAHDMPGEAGDEGTLTFMQGGPTGGYWRFEKD